MKELLGFFTGLAFWAAVLGGWITAILNDCASKEWGWVIVSVVMPPLGMFRGWLMWLGVV